MECENCKELLWVYINNDISDKNIIKDIEEHLKVCNDCNEELNIITKITNSLNKLEQEELPSNFHNDLMNKLNIENLDRNNISAIKKHADQHIVLFSNWKQLGLLASAAVLLLFIGFSGQQGNSASENLSASSDVDSGMSTNDVMIMETAVNDTGDQYSIDIINNGDSIAMGEVYNLENGFSQEELETLVRMPENTETEIVFTGEMNEFGDLPVAYIPEEIPDIPMNMSRSIDTPYTEENIAMGGFGGEVIDGISNEISNEIDATKTQISYVPENLETMNMPMDKNRSIDNPNEFTEELNELNQKIHNDKKVDENGYEGMVTTSNEIPTDNKYTMNYDMANQKIIVSTNENINPVDEFMKSLYSISSGTIIDAYENKIMIYFSPTEEDIVLDILNNIGNIETIENMDKKNKDKENKDKLGISSEFIYSLIEFN